MERTTTILICDGCNQPCPGPAVERRGYWGRHYCLCPPCVVRGLVLVPSRGAERGGSAVGYVVRHAPPVVVMNDEGRAT